MLLEAFSPRRGAGNRPADGRAGGARAVAAARSMAALALLVAGASTTFAQQQSPDAGPSPLALAGAYSASVEMVRVPVVVVDAAGRFVPNLEQADFGVDDGGRTHRVEHFVSDAAPASVGILLDASGLMQEYESGVRLAVTRVAESLRPDDDLFILAYGPAVATLVEPTTDKVAAIAALDHYPVGDGADRTLYDALDAGLATLERSPHDKRSLIIIGAGDDTASRVGEIDVQQHIYRTGVSIHAVVLVQRPERTFNAPSRVNRLQTLPEIAHFTGGLVAQRPQLWGRYGGADEWFAAAGTDITTYIKHQYVLHYVPTNPPRAGTWRAIRVAVEGNYREIRARSGYMR